MRTTGGDILSLAKSILHSSEQIVEYLEQQKHPLPSFEAIANDPPTTYQYETMRTQLSEAATDLMRLVNGPKQYYRHTAVSHFDGAALQSALALGLFEIVPEEGSRSLTELASQAGVDEQRIGQMMRYLASQRVFEEVEEGVFRHTATSLVAARDGDIRALMEYMLGDVLKASSELADWARAAPHASNSDNCPFSSRHKVSLYEYLAQNPAKAVTFARAMGGATKFDRQTDEIITNFPWKKLTGGKVVDVGGGSGHVSMGLAELFPTLQVVVQDKSPKMLAQGQTLDVYPRVRERVTFAQYDFFTDQPVHDADAFILRQIAHNWNDNDLVKIFRAFIPAMEKCRPGTPLLINDTLLPALGTVTRVEEYASRQLDMLMLVVLGARQRSEKQFRHVLKAADERFELVKVSSEGSMGLLEVHLKI